MIAELEQRLETSKAVRRRFEPQWYVNLAYYNGYQWLMWDGTRLYEPPPGETEQRPVDNRIQPIVRTEVAKMTKQRPTFVGTPRTENDEDVQSALTAERVSEYLWTELDLALKLRQALTWSRVVCAGFWKVYWDSEKGSKVNVLAGPDGKAMTDQAGRLMRPDRGEVQAVLSAMPEDQRPQTRQVSMGEACVEVKTPLELYPDSLATEEGLSSCEWIIEDSVRSMEYVRRRYPDKADQITPDAYATPGAAEARLPGIAMPTSTPQGMQGVRVREFWSRPNSEFPKGKRVVWANEIILYEGDNPYSCLPYVMFRGVPAPGRFWPTSVTEQLVSPQTELNKLTAQVLENAYRVGNPPLAHAEGLDIDWHGLPGEKIAYENDGTPNAIPQFLTVPELPAYLREHFQRIENSFREISGQHEVTSGTVPAGVTAASAINLLQEQDDTRLGPDISEMENVLGAAGTQLLELVARYYSDQRMIRLAGEDGAWDIFDFRGQMLNGHTQVSVQAGSAMPRSKAAKQAAISSVLGLFVQNGMPIDQRNLRKVMADYDVGGLERLFADLAADDRQVTRENRQLSQAGMLPINSFDNDEAHIDGHEEFQKSGRYAQLIESNPQVGVAFEQHVMLHRDRLVQAQGPMVAPPGTNGPQGPPNGQPGMPADQAVPPGAPNGGAPPGGPGAQVLSPPTGY